MMVIEFTENEIQEIQNLSKNHPHSYVRLKAFALLLINYQIPIKKILKILNICENTLRSYYKNYLETGIDTIKSINFNKPQSKLSSFEEEIKKYVKESPPATIKQACSEIEKLTGIQLKKTQMRSYLKSIGVKCRKVAGIPAKANIEKQKQFLEQELQPIIDEARDGQCVLFFVDSAHFVQGSFLGYLWSFCRMFVKTPSGRNRYNVLGALNAITKELITVSNDTYITSTQVCELLHLLAKNTTLPIVVVLDNARYQRCDLVMKLAKELNIELLFLPPYSPNLNLIERLWKFIKKECLNSKYYETFQSFKTAIKSFLCNMHKEHKDALNSLLTLSFQTFTEEQFNDMAYSR
jgi:transposase